MDSPLHAQSVNPPMPRLLPARLLLFITLLWPGLPAVAEPTASQTTDQTSGEVTLAGQTFSVELVSTPAQRARGLMFRASMPADHGMLFLFPRPRPMAFWMKNTAMPLDILFFDQQLRLINIHHNVPPCRSSRCAHYASEHPAAMVLELNGGRSAALALKPGAQLRITHPRQPPQAQ